MPLRLVRRPKSPYWTIRGSIRGARLEESTKTADRRLAEEIRAAREAQFYSELIYGKKTAKTFPCRVELLGRGGDRRFLSLVLEYFGTMPLAKIGQEELDEGARKLFPKASLSTRNRQFFTPASAVLHHAAKKGWCPKPIIARPKQSPARVRWLEPAEADRLIAASADHLRPLIVFLLYTGARAGEALWLEWKDVDLSRSHVQFLKTKNHEPRGVPCTLEL
jgi:integrase